ncbi:hypothetical protein GPEL0_01r4098 [Geoanaerobacter pelophilus]|uniref:Uncharacterized protein n=1 Tax=Geoanaerobacter pelophilus TaxID=60036 RepID=A0ABQ0MLP6_9BACT|nr:hypothetical protein [Geoanaerobacter pelophilus]GAW67983.1 hypothetical protein GPEL0_01r4098 [Geoanaerobacter pelophilus]
MEKVWNALKVIIPTILASPPLAKGVYLMTALFFAMSVATIAYYYFNPPTLPDEPYAGFDQKFKEILSVTRMKESGGLLHVVYGNIADVKNTTVVLPINEEFDLMQRGPRSVLAAFEPHSVTGVPFYDWVDNEFKKLPKPIGKGIGACRFVKLQNESNNLNGAILVVTTRNLGTDPKLYGLYHNTPIEGLDQILDKVIQEAQKQKIDSLAIPLLCSGYASISITANNPSLKMKLDRLITLGTIQKLEETLKDSSSRVKRAMVVVFPTSNSDSSLLNDTLRFTSLSKEEQVKFIKQEIEAFKVAANPVQNTKGVSETPQVSTSPPQ